MGKVFLHSFKSLMYTKYDADGRESENCLSSISLFSSKVKDSALLLRDENCGVLDEDDGIIWKSIIWGIGIL